MQGKFFLGAAACKEQSMDIWQHIIHPRDVWGHLSRYLKQGGHAAVQREVVRSLRLRARDVVLDLGGGGHALAQLALYSGTVYGVPARQRYRRPRYATAMTWPGAGSISAGARSPPCRSLRPCSTSSPRSNPRSGQGTCPPACARSGACCGPAASACWCALTSGRPVPAGHTVDELNALADRAGLLCLPPLRLRGKGRVVLHWLQPACDLCRPMPLDVFPAGRAQAC